MCSEGKIHHPEVQQVLKLDLELKSIKIEHQLMRISTGWRRAILASCLPATVNLVLFQNVNKHDCKENILHILKVTVLCCGLRLV